MTDPWWKGKALHQSTHEAINREHYPGTRQLCVECDEPTERCEDDSLFVEDVGPLCPECYRAAAPDDDDHGSCDECGCNLDEEEVFWGVCDQCDYMRSTNR